MRTECVFCVTQCSRGNYRGFPNGNCDFVMMNDDCESDLKMENVIFVYPRPPISWGRYIPKKIDKFLDLLKARSLGSLHPPNKCASTVCAEMGF